MAGKCGKFEVNVIGRNLGTYPIRAAVRTNHIVRSFFPPLAWRETLKRDEGSKEELVKYLKLLP